MSKAEQASTEITTKLSQHAAKSALRIYMKEFSVFRNDELPAFVLGKEIIQVVSEDTMTVARHKKTKHAGWYAQGVEYISQGKPDQEKKDRFLFIDDYEAEVIEFSSQQQAKKDLEFKS